MVLSYLKKSFNLCVISKYWANVYWAGHSYILEYKLIKLLLFTDTPMILRFMLFAHKINPIAKPDWITIVINPIRITVWSEHKSKWMIVINPSSTSNQTPPPPPLPLLGARKPPPICNFSSRSIFKFQFDQFPSSVTCLMSPIRHQLSSSPICATLALANSTTPSTTISSPLVLLKFTSINFDNVSNIQLSSFWLKSRGGGKWHDVTQPSDLRYMTGKIGKPAGIFDNYHPGPGQNNCVVMVIKALQWSEMIYEAYK